MRTTTTLLLAAVLLVLLPGVASAHASFDVSQLPAGGAQDLVLRVPLERDAANDLVEVLVPGAFTVTACPAAPGWDCEQAATADGDTVVTLTRGPDGAGDTERFALAVQAPAGEGVYAFPTIQTYDDGVEAAWIGEPGSDQPAPRIQVGDETAAVEFSGDATPHTDLADEEAPATPTPTPTTTPTSDASPAPSPTAEDGPTDEEPAPAATGTDPEVVDDAGPSALLVAVGLVLAAVAVAAAVARLRSR